MTVVSGLSEEDDLKELASTLKSKMACGGTSKDGEIQLQGDHRRRIVDALIEEGFSRANIDVK